MQVGNTPGPPAREAGHVRVVSQHPSPWCLLHAGVHVSGALGHRHVRDCQEDELSVAVSRTHHLHLVALRAFREREGTMADDDVVIWGPLVIAPDSTCKIGLQDLRRRSGHNKIEKMGNDNNTLLQSTDRLLHRLHYQSLQLAAEILVQHCCRETWNHQRAEQPLRHRIVVATLSLILLRGLGSRLGRALRRAHGDNTIGPISVSIEGDINES